ncbi:MAG: PAS domain S-box protein [Cyclobacteriaceae bacterium]
MSRSTEELILANLREHICIIRFDTSFYIDYCNEKAAELLGYESPDVIGKPVETFIQLKDTPLDQNPFHQALMGSTISTTSFISARKQQYQGELLLSPFRNDSAEISGGLISIYAQPEPVNAQEAAPYPLADDLTTLLLHNSPIYYSVLDENGQIIFLNDYYIKMWPYEIQDSLIGRNIYELVPKQYAHIYTDNIRKVVKSGKALISEEPGLRADGSEGYFLVHKFPVTGPYRRLAGIVATDITEQKQKESRIRQLNQQLNESRRYYELLAKNITDLVTLHDEEGKTVYTTPSILRLIGYEPQQVLGQSVFLMIHSEDEANFALEFRKALEGQTINLQYRRQNAQGRYIWLEVSARSILIKDKTHVLAVSRDISDKKEADKKLIEREQYLSSLLHSQTNFLIRTDVHYRYTFANERYLVKFSEKDNLSGRSILPGLHPEDRNAFKNMVESCISQPGSIFPLSFRRESPNGQPVWLEWEFIGIPDASGTVREIQGVGSDISDRKRQDYALLRKQKELSSIIDSQTNYLIRTDMEGNFTFANPAFLSKFSYFGDLIGKSSLLTIHPDDHDKTLAMANECISHPGKMVSIELRKPAPDGKFSVNYWEFIAITDEEGNPTEVQGVGYDITERKQARDAVEKSEAFLKALIENTNDAIWAVDENFRLAFANANFSLLLRTSYGIEAEPGKSFMDKLPPKVHEIWKAFHTKARLEGRFRTEMSQEIEGKTLYFEVSINPIFDEQQQLIGHSVFAHDISARKQIEHQLLSANRSAEEALRARDTFLSMITHELKTPLNAILGMSQLMQNTHLSMNQRKYTDSLSYSTRMLNSLINDILDYTSLQSGKFSMDNIDFNLHKILQQTVNLYQNKALKNGLKLVYLQKDELPNYVNGDPIRLGQILNNLLDNAFKFTEDGSITIEAMPAKVNGKQGPVRIRISDTGMGIPQEMLAEVFEPFRQGTPEINQVYGGRGLGLAIVKNLVEHMGGHINLSSKEGEGTTFSLYLPFRQSTSTEIHEFKPREVQHDSQRLQGYRLLYIEDINVNQILMKGICEQWGLELDVASNGMEGLNMVQENDYDMILMDILMPGMSGYETCRQIRQLEHEKYRKIPIVAVTAYQGHEMEEMLQEAGMNDYINKPIDFPELSGILHHYLTHNKPEENLQEGINMNEAYFDRLEKMAFQDKDRYISFLENLRSEFEKSRNELQQAVKLADNEKISTIRHHTIALLSMFSSRQQAFIQELKSLHVEKGKASHAREKLRHISDNFDLILQKIEQKISELKS